MAGGRRTVHVLAVLGIVAGLPVTSAGVAAADEPQLSRPLAATVHRVPVTSVDQVVTPTGDVTAKLVNDRSQQASAFTLQAGGEWEQDETLQPIPRDRLGLPTGVMDSVTWLSTQYYNVPDRITVERGPGDFDTSPEAAAYQLAIWSFSDRDDVDLAALPDTVVTRRAKVLAAAAAESSEPDRSSPIAEATLTLSVDEEHFEGKHFRAHLEEKAPAEANLQDELVLFTVDDEPVRVMQTDRNGNAFLDIPNDRSDMLGSVQAAWSTQLAQGTVLEGAGGAVILFQPLSAVLETPGIAHQELGFKEIVERVAALALRPVVSAPLWLAFAGILAVAFVVSFFVPEFKNRLQGMRPRSLVLTLAGCLAVVALGGALMGAWQEREFYDDWAARPEIDEASSDGAAPPPVEVSWVGETSSFQGQHEGFFSGRCAFDGVDRSAWLSGRNRGTGQFLVVGFAEPTLVSRIDVVPGWFDTQQDYDLTGKPSDLLLFNEAGMVSRQALPEGLAFEDGPRPVPLELEEPLPANQLYVMVTRIEGDTRRYSAITEITVRGTPLDEPRRRGSEIDWDTVLPEVTKVEECAASD